MQYAICLVSSGRVFDSKVSDGERIVGNIINVRGDEIVFGSKVHNGQCILGDVSNIPVDEHEHILSGKDHNGRYVPDNEHIVRSVREWLAGCETFTPSAEC